MKKLYIYFIWLTSCTGLLAQAPLTFHDFSAATIKGDTINLSKYYGSKVMVVNTASYCGYTYEFGQLQQLYDEYSKYHFTIIGFPCDDFGNQDPYNDSIINAFCTGNYDVTFQMMSKIAIISKDTAPLYKWLQQKSLNGVESAGVTWNFNKFLIDESGHWVNHFISPVSPLDTAITNWIMSLSSIPPTPISTQVERIPSSANFSFSPPVENGVKNYSLPTNPPATKYNEITTGINNVSSSAELIKINSSNPTGSVIDITLSSAQQISADLYSADGKLIANLFDGKPEGEMRIVYPVSSLPSGMYFIHVQGATAQKTIRYLVEK